MRIKRSVKPVWVFYTFSALFLVRALPILRSPFGLLRSVALVLQIFWLAFLLTGILVLASKKARYIGEGYLVMNPIPFAGQLSNLYLAIALACLVFFVVALPTTMPLLLIICLHGLIPFQHAGILLRDDILILPMRGVQVPLKDIDSVSIADTWPNLVAVSIRSRSRGQVYRFMISQKHRELFCQIVCS